MGAYNYKFPSKPYFSFIHQLWYVMFLFTFGSKCFNNLVISSLSHELPSIFNFHINSASLGLLFSVLNFKFNPVWSENILYLISVLKCLETCWVTWHTISRRLFHVSVRRTCILKSVDGVLHNDQLDVKLADNVQVVLTCLSILCFET